MKIRSKSIVAVLALAIAAGAGYALTRKPDLPPMRFATLSGESIAMSDLLGKVVVINFWATSCVTCVREMPAMIDTWNKYAPRGYDMVAVAMSYDHPNLVADFARSRSLPFKVALDSDGALAKGFGNVRLTPTTILFDRRGRVIKRILGEPEWAEFHALVERALAEPG